MSNYIKTIGDKRYFALDDYFGKHNYGYVEAKENEIWLTFEIGDREVLKDLPK